MGDHRPEPRAGKGKRGIGRGSQPEIVMRCTTNCILERPTRSSSCTSSPAQVGRFVLLWSIRRNLQCRPSPPITSSVSFTTFVQPLSLPHAIVSPRCCITDALPSTTVLLSWFHVLVCRAAGAAVAILRCNWSTRVHLLGIVTFGFGS